MGMRIGIGIGVARARGGATPDTTAPTLVSVVANADGTIDWTFSEAVTVTTNDATTRAQFFTEATDAEDGTGAALTLSIAGSVVTTTHNVNPSRDENWTATYSAGEAAQYKLRDASLNYVAAVVERSMSTTSAPVDSSAPTVGTWAINAAGTRITGVSGEWLKALALAATSDFNLDGTASEVTHIEIYSNGYDESWVELTVSPAIFAGETVLIDMTVSFPPDMFDLSNNNVANFSNVAVTNNSTVAYAPSNGAAAASLRFYVPLHQAAVTLDNTAGDPGDGANAFASAANSGTLGGTLAGNAVKPHWGKGVDNLGRLAFTTARSASSSVAASNFVLLSDGAGNRTIIGAFSVESTSIAQNMWSTKSTPGTGTGQGATLLISGGKLTYSIGNGSAEQRWQSTTSPSMGVWYWYRIQITSSGVTLFLDGVQEATAAYTITPDADDPGQTLMIGDDTADILGMVTPPVIWAATLGAPELALAEVWVQQFTDSYPTVTAAYDAECANAKTLYTCAAGATVDRSGSYALTLNGTPTIADDATINSYQSFLADGTDDYAYSNGLATDASGTDKAAGIIAVMKVTNTAAVKTFACWDVAVGTGQLKINYSATETPGFVITDDVAAADTDNAAAASSSAVWQTVMFAHTGTKCAILHEFSGNYSHSPNLTASDVGAKTVDLFTLCAARPLSVAATFFAGNWAAVAVFSGKRPNNAQTFLLAHAARAQYLIT